MARFSGVVGYATRVQTVPGVWEDKIVEKMYYGDVLKDRSVNEPSKGVNDNIRLKNTISIVADPYAVENYMHIQFVKFMGIRWTIANIEVQYPRLLMTLGGEYNG